MMLLVVPNYRIVGQANIFICSYELEVLRILQEKTSRWQVFSTRWTAIDLFPARNVYKETMEGAYGGLLVRVNDRY